VERTIGIASIKSTLDKKELIDSLALIATIPPTKPLEKRVTLGISIKNYDDWLYKIIYASEGIEGKTILQHLVEYYSANPQIPITRRPNLIHVAGKYVIFRVVEGMAVGSAPNCL